MNRNTSESLVKRAKSGASMNRRQKGSEVLEFSMVLLPLMAMLTVMLDTGWATFTKSTLERAVRIGVTKGINLQAAQIAQGSCLTAAVKSAVQQNAFGLLAGSSGLSLIKVNYFQPPAPNSTDPVTDVSQKPDGNAPGNLLQVSVQNYSLAPLLPRIADWNQSADNSPMVMNASSAGMIEPSKDLPCIGAAP